jgi:hypothetical protein
LVQLLANAHPEIIQNGGYKADGATYFCQHFPLNSRLFLTDFDKKAHFGKLKQNANEIYLFEFTIFSWWQNQRWRSFFILL